MSKQTKLQSDNPSKDILIATIGGFSIFNINKSFPNEKFEKKVQSKYYLKIDKLHKNTKVTLNSFLGYSVIKYKIKTHVLDKIIPFYYLGTDGPNIGTTLNPLELITLFKNGNVKLYKHFLWNFKENFAILSIAFTIKDRLKEEYLPLIIKVISFEDEPFEKNKSVQYTQTSIKYHRYNPLELTMTSEDRIIESINEFRFFIEKSVIESVKIPKVTTRINFKNS